MFSRFDTIPACDGRTDVQPISITCFSIADARNKIYVKGKNGLFFASFATNVPQNVTSEGYKQTKILLAPLAALFYTHKTRMNGLSCGEESMTIYSAVLIQYHRVTDGRTDVQLISTQHS